MHGVHCIWYAHTPSYAYQIASCYAYQLPTSYSLLRVPATHLLPNLFVLVCTASGSTLVPPTRTR
eukprot:3711919-Rhodomonas_salina.1